MRAGSIQQETLITSLVLAGAVFAFAYLADQMLIGAGVAVGLVVGSFNGFIIKAALDRRAPMLITSVFRLGLFTLLGLSAARLLGGSIWPVVAGIAAAQLVMVGVGVRQGRRA
ncbi:MAG TPA: hypothetical protein VN940_04240 [Candidatus Dormibacteraeota bacterium]|nr:hypothetical protein [Candidatus Dormibacteraeota bacterium]